MTMIARYRNLGVKHKLKLIILFAVMAALIPASVAVVAFDQIAARRDMRNDLDVLAEMVGANSTAAVTFGDRRAAEELLSGLKAKKHIVTAVIYAEDGKPFASYRRKADTHTPLPVLRSSMSRFEEDRLIVYRDIKLANQIAGVIYLESDLGQLHERLTHFAWTVFLILLISSALAMALSSKLQRAVSGPIAHLAGVAKTVSGQKNYNVRAVKQSDDDLGQLIDSFNGMLVEIESRDRELLNRRDVLEKEVASRTAELLIAKERAEAANQTKTEYLGEIKRLNDELKQENTRMSTELEVTRRLQQMMLPRDDDMRQIANLDISGCMESAAEVGGDYYDVISKDGRVAFGIGDVTGHGLESGVIAIMVHTAVRTLLANGPYKCGTFFNVLNRVIYGNVRRMNCDRNLTFSLLQYQDNFVTISGQHEEVLIVRGNGSLERHDTLELGFPLGLEEDISGFIAETRVPLALGDVMVVYTDGITEAANSVGVAFGIERLSEAVRLNHARPSEAIRQAVLVSLREYIGDQCLQDDISLLVIKPA
ncbi:MAG TPA: SpoIIE family protein phosphatase [Bryobacteraceae bacterium]|nr:SpoIIE family protein phosphatase [Bryobacteraceae bacterium]